MKTIFTFISNNKKSALLSVFFFVCLLIQAQTTHNVQVSNFTFTPSSLTIENGDMVVWTNVEGFHNVDGMVGTFPSNPESFGNSIGSAPWEYSHVFTVSGNYNYQCDVHPLQMQGTIVVNDVATAVDDLSVSSGIIVYPNPAGDKVSIQSAESIPANTFIIFYNSLGSKVKIDRLASDENQVEYNLNDLNAGIYFIKIENQDLQRVIKLIKQ